MNNSATIKLFLPQGDAKRFRTGEVSNWTGKALAAPRTELDEMLKRDELSDAGVYFLLGENPGTGEALAYIGEAEVIRERLKQHKAKDFWNAVVVFVSKDENLTKAHIRYLESRLIDEATEIGRYKLENQKLNKPKLPESDREDMEVFLSRIRQVFPVLGSDLLTPIASSNKNISTEPVLICKVKEALAKGRRTTTGFVVYQDSTAVADVRTSAQNHHGYVLQMRNKMLEEGFLIKQNNLLVFTKDVEFASPSAAASIVHGGGANGLTAWKDNYGKTLKQLED
jgi:Domain of unknown function (DUF4357)